MRAAHEAAGCTNGEVFESGSGRVVWDGDFPATALIALHRFLDIAIHTHVDKVRTWVHIGVTKFHDLQTNAVVRCRAYDRFLWPTEIIGDLARSRGCGFLCPCGRIGAEYLSECIHP